MTLVGGRSVHPVNVRVGGFYRLPTGAELRALRAGRCVRAREDAVGDGPAGVRLRLPRLRAAVRVPVAARPERLPARVRLAGHQRRAAAFDVARVRPARRRGARRALQRPARPAATGPAVRRRPAGPLLAQPRPALAAGRGGRRGRRASGATCRNPFRSIIVRAVELVDACDEALRIIDGWRGAPARRPSTVPARAGEGTARPRRRAALLYHRYRLDEPTARSSTPRSCRRPRRTSRASRPTCGPSSQARLAPAARRADPPVRAGDPQLRPVHLLRHPLPATCRWSGRDGRADDALVVGVGNPVRGDDAVGPAVAALVRARSHPGVRVVEVHEDPTALLHLWAARRQVVLVDAVCSGAAAGTLVELDLRQQPLPRTATASTHGIGLADVVELGRALAGCRPRSSSSGSNWARSEREPACPSRCSPGCGRRQSESTSWSASRLPDVASPPQSTFNRDQWPTPWRKTSNRKRWTRRSIKRCGGRVVVGRGERVSKIGVANPTSSLEARWTPTGHPRDRTVREDRRPAESRAAVGAGPPAGGHRPQALRRRAACPGGFALTGTKADERQTLLGIFNADPGLVADRPGQVLIGDKNYYGRDFEAALDQAGVRLLRPHPQRRAGPRWCALVRTPAANHRVDQPKLQGQLDLERHGEHTVAGVLVDADRPLRIPGRPGTERCTEASAPALARPSAP